MTARPLAQAGMAFGVLATCSALASTPVINGAKLNTRIFNDYPGSTLSTSNLYPASISFSDAGVGAPGGPFANRHNFRLSDNGGASDAVFLNDSSFTFEADVTLTGTAPVEGGLNVSPWWSPQVDGVFMLNGASGEIACFGGRLPFYSFTGNHGATYTMGQKVHQKVMYSPNELQAGGPGTIQYTLTIGPNTYTSPQLAFDAGNPNEGPIYGWYGITNGAEVGGYVQVMNGGVSHTGGALFENMVFSNVPEPGTLALLALGVLPLLRRRA